MSSSRASHRRPDSFVTVPPFADGVALPLLRDAWDGAIADLAREQHGVVARHQLSRIGLTPAAIRHRVSRGRLHPVHPGVFAVGFRKLTPRGWWIAAVFYGGEGAVLSHRAAAALWGLLDGSPAKIDVLVVRSRPERTGARPRHVRDIPPDDCVVVDGIPCTSVARTLQDLAATSTERTLDRALRRAEERRIFDRFAIEEMLQRSRPGVGVLRTALAVFAGDELARRRMKSELERRFLELLRRHDFVLPSTNVVVRTPWNDYEVDTLWPTQRIVVELDGWWSHYDRESFRRDHQRATDVRAAGFEVSRLSWDQVVENERGTVERLARFLPRVEASSSASTPSRPR